MRSAKAGRQTKRLPEADPTPYGRFTLWVTGGGASENITAGRGRPSVADEDVRTPNGDNQGMVLHDLLARDHERLDVFLERIVRSDGTVDVESDAEFRRGLLRHIGIEERILFPLLRNDPAGARLIGQLHRDHAALSALLVVPPTSAEVDAIRAILARHNPLEEGSGGMYERAEERAGEALSEVIGRVRSYPEVPLARHADTPVVRRSIAQLVREAEEGWRLLDAERGMGN